ncbi:hypothetical protein H0484_12465 [Pusillimonas sp. CC-YST705]|uniref:Capsular polysaccharide biosynthesis protein n=1 Tax=Mesopusillimonas faecipullorum TaxID=2755040 RepID=A0ABS8CET2_9BURK|nr:hypothetical protein [Mesopusillimonas faecipullorum]MCB5364560.1 hypothetical protein [Mesopusillimonas faecipullorum]
MRSTLTQLSIASLTLTLPLKAMAQVFPQAMDYVMQLQSSVQSNSNPALITESNGNPQSSTALINTLGIAARIPLLSEDTRLDLAGVVGNAHFSNQHQLDYQPRLFDGTLHWRIGRLFSGKTGYQYHRERYQSDRLWPESDTVSTRRWEGEAGMNISEDWTLPLFRLFDSSTRYGALPNQQLFNRNEKGWEVSARYQARHGSSLSLGWAQSRTTLPLRHTLNRTDLDDAYRDRELFTQAYWQYSVKTSFYVRAGWLQRRYQNFSERDTSLLTLDTQAIWQYSPKTELRLGLWQRPYSNDEDPSISYSTRRGLGLTALWQATPKLSLTLQAVYENQEDTRFDNQHVRSPLTRYGSRLSWKAGPNLDVILDGYHARKRGADPWNRYTQNVVRLGIVLYTDSGNERVAPLLNPLACGWAYQEASLCP